MMFPAAPRSSSRLSGSSLRNGLLAGGLVLALAPVACRPRPPPPPSEAALHADRLGKLRSEIADLTPSRGCAKASECRVVGIGHNRCGGPRQHIVYCGKGADEAALARKNDELTKLEEEDDKKLVEPPPCKKSVAPQIEMVDSVCRAKL